MLLSNSKTFHGIGIQIHDLAGLFCLVNLLPVEINYARYSTTVDATTMENGLALHNVKVYPHNY